MGNALTEEQFEQLLRETRAFLADAPAITNAILRKRAGIVYDQATRFFNEAMARGLLERRGTASSIRYVLPGAPD